MSAIPRPSRTASPRNSASPKRRPLHARSDSDTNELAGSAPGSQRNSKTDADFVYSQSPFPRLPSQVLRPAGQPWVFEDSSATAPLASPPASPSARSPRWPLDAARPSRSRSPRDKGKGKAKAVLSSRDDLPAIDTSMPPPPSRSSPRSPHHSGRASAKTPERANSKVRSIVSAIEEASLRSESLPPTPHQHSRPRLSPRPSPGPFYASPPLSDEPIPELPPLLPSIEDSGLHSVQSPILDSEEPFTALPSSVRASVEPQTDPLDAPPSSPPLVDSDAGLPELPVLRPFQLMRSNETLRSELQQRPRSSSAPTGATDELLQALIASGANIQYPRLEKPSIASMDTDSSSLRRAFPQPLNLRRKQGQSQLAQARSADDSDENDGFVLEYDDRVRLPHVQERPSTPPRQQDPDQSLSSHWTPSRWTAELEDTVPELNPHALRAQHSFYGERDSLDERPGSVCSTQSSASVGFYRFLNDSKTAWAKSYYSGNGTLRNVTPPYLSATSLGRHSSSVRRRSYSASLSGMSLSASQESEEAFDQIYIPRRRPFQRKPVHIPAIADPSSSQGPQLSQSRPESQAEPGQPEIVEYVESPRRAHRPSGRVREAQAPPLHWSQQYDLMGPVPHLSPDRSANPRYSVLRPPSLDGYGWFTPANVQLGLALLGLVLPFCWMIGGCLRLPPKPVMPVADPENGSPEVTPEMQQAFFEDPEVKQYHKARFLRRVNRAMSFTGLCVIAAVITLAVIATR